MADQNQLPEGTDEIIDGAGYGDDAVDVPTGAEDGLGSAPDAIGSSSHDRTAQAAVGGGNPYASMSDGSEESQGAGGAFSAGDWSAENIRSTVQDRAQGLMDTASDHARAYVAQGLDYTTNALDDVIRMVDDAATTIDDKVGVQYGDYARQASSAISGLADTLRMKDADALFADAQDVIRKSPAIAIGAAAALGFVVARILKAGAATVEAGATAAGGSGRTPTLAEDDPIIPRA